MVLAKKSQQETSKLYLATQSACLYAMSQGEQEPSICLRLPLRYVRYLGLSHSLWAPVFSVEPPEIVTAKL